MPEPVRCVLLSVGTELTEGKIQDSHLQFFAQELTRRGVTIERCVHLPDKRPLFLNELLRSVSDAEMVIVTGGLGPTSDDLTREVVAEAAGVGLSYYPEVWEALERRFAGRKLAESNRRQCYAPLGFGLIENRHGTAPGFHVRIGKAIVLALPGPPRELQPMFRDGVLPILRESFTLAAEETLEGTAHLIGESLLEDALSKCAVGGVEWGTRIADDRIAFSLRGASAEERERFYSSLVSLVGETHIRRGDRGAAEVLLDALLSDHATFAVAESCTGGTVSKWLTDVPGSSKAFLGGVIAYANSVKQALLGVSAELLAEHGAVSAEVAEAMSRGAIRLTGARYGLAITGVAGPDGGTADKPVGTVWVAAASARGELRVELFRLPGSREAVRRRSASAACIMMECLVLGRDWKLYDA